MKSTRLLDVCAGIAFIGIAVAIIWIAIPVGVQEPKKVKFAALSPSYYPRLVCYCLLAIGVLLVATRSMKRRLDESVAAKEPKTADRFQTTIPMLLVIAATLFLYYWFLPELGFVVSSTVALLIFMWLAGERQLWALIVIPLLVPLLLYFFFTRVANIPIPPGILQSVLVGS